MSSNAKFTYMWMIENYNRHPQTNGEFIRSPNLRLKQFHNTDWYIRLYPGGDLAESADYVSCYLCRSNDDGPPNIELRYILSISHFTAEMLVESFKKNSTSGIRELVNRNFVKHLPVCVIECHMQMSSSVVTTADITKEPTNCFAPYFLKSQLMIPEVLKETSMEVEQEMCATRKALRLYSSQSFVCTRILVEKRILTCAIKDYLCLESKRSKHIPVALPSATIILALFLITKDGGDLLEIEICVDTDRRPNCLLICKVELIDLNRRVRSCVEKEHLFQSFEDSEDWNFGHPFKWNDLKEKRIANLRFTFTFSDGRCFSDIEWATKADDCIGLLNIPNDVTKDLHRMFTEKRFCDVTIRAQGKSFEAHKTVLCLRSPVFAAMFEGGKAAICESGMEKFNPRIWRNLDIIEIDDLDSSTVSQMLRFMYTGIIEELNAGNATKLFAAGVKYQIPSLKVQCRNVLKNNLTLDNICTVLLLADTYKDDELLQSSISFIYYHRKDVLKSEKWEEIKKNNVCLALDTLTKVCMRYLPTF